MRKIFGNSSIRQSILVPTILIVIVSLIISTTISFISNNNTTTSIVEDTSKEINKQIILNFENYIEGVIETADYIQQRTIEYGLRNENNKLFSVYSEAVDVQSDIESIVLIDMAGDEIVSSTNKDISLNDLRNKEWYLDAISESSIYHFSSPHQQDIFYDSTTQVITVTKVIDYYINNLKLKGVLVVDINTSNIIRLSNTTNLGDGGHIVILNDDDSLIFTNYDPCAGGDCESIALAKDIFGGESVEIDGKSMYLNINTITTTRWRMATFINTDIIKQTSRYNLIVAAVVLISTLFVSGVVSSVVSRRISSPINELKDHMQKIESGDFYQEITISGQKEVIVLAHSFNAMIEEIRTLMETVVTEQRAKRRTEFQALQSQINPHFLYNTLDSIIYLAENKMNEKVIEMVIALSKFFRISISRGKNIILLKEELEHARNYLLIQQIRYNEKFKFIFEISEDVRNCKVVKLSLQPLIENAIYHGINTEYDSGAIIIRAFQENDKLILEVEDDGYGITDDKIEEIYQNIRFESPSKSIGLRNVYQRLKIYYGEATKFEIESELDEKTIIRLIIPIKGAQ